MDQDLLFTVENHIARITFNRTERHNALSIGMRRRWVEIVSTINADPDIFVGILGGAGERAFCAGMDLKETAERDAQGKRRIGTNKLPQFPEKPLVAAINGYCLAGGLEMALICDIRIATESATFGLPEVRRGMMPLIAVNLLPGIVPRGEAAYLLLSGETIDARKALEIGLIHKVLPDKAALEAEAERIASAIALGAPLAVQAAKAMLLKNSGVATEQGFADALAAKFRLQESEDAKEGPRAFAEKRAPRWQGR